MNGTPDDSSLLSSTGFLRGTHVSNTRFDEEPSLLMFAVNMVLKTHEIQCISADLPANVRCNVYVQVIWCFCEELDLFCKCSRSVA